MAENLVFPFPRRKVASAAPWALGIILTAAVMVFREPLAQAPVGWLLAAWLLAFAVGLAGAVRAWGLRSPAASSPPPAPALPGEELYRQLFEHNPAAVYRSTVDGRLLDCNEALVRMFGYDHRDELLAQPASALYFDPSDRATLIEKLFQEGALHNIEVRLRRGNGEPFWALLNGGLLPPSAAGSPSVLEGTLLDITERKRVEEALRESESVLRSFYDAAPLMMGVVEVVGREIRHVSDNLTAARMFGRSPEELRGRLAREVGAVLPRALREWRERFRESEREGRPVRFEQLHELAAGPRWVAATVSFIGRTNEDLARFCYVIDDITERKLAEQALRESEAAIRSLHTLATDHDLTFEEKIRALLALGCEVFRLESGALLRVQGERCQVVEARSAGPLVRGAVLDLDDTFCRLTVAAAGPVAFARREEAPPGSVLRPLPEAYIGAPVQVAGHLFGTVGFAGREVRQTPFRQADTELLQLMALWLGSELERRQRDREVDLLVELGNLLQTCGTTEEAYRVVARQARQLFPDLVGVLYRLDAARADLEPVASWGAAEGAAAQLCQRDDCWALRLGRGHLVRDPATDLLCAHVAEPLPASTLCVPLTAHGEALGVLHLCTGAGGGAAPLTDAVRRLAETAAEQVAMTAANLELRDTLRHQSIRDPLTGLFNRRHFQDSLDREVRRAQQSGTPLGLLLLDIDHFKKVNDTYTHEGGDRVLGEVGAFLRRHVRGNDIPCRYGGEEIAILLPRASLEATCARAEELRRGIKELPITFQGGRLESVTVSIGVAVLPDHGDQGAALVRAADEALYVSKKNGRDRVTVPGDPPGEVLEG